MNRLCRVAYQHRRILGCLRRFSRQTAHLLRDNGKAFSGTSCPCRFHRCIQRQNIGLECNVIDRFQNFFYLVRAVLNLVHRLHQMLHFLIAHRDLFSGLVGLMANLHRLVCGAFCLLVDLAEPRRKFLHRACLLRGALTEHLGTGGQLRAGRCHLLCRIVHLMHGIAQLTLHMAHRIQDIAEASDIHLLMLGVDIKILICHLCQHITDIMNDHSQPFDQRSRRICEHPGLIFGCNSGHWCFQITFHKQLHSLCTGFHRSADMCSQHQCDNDGCHDRQYDHREVNHHGIARRRQII